MMNLKVMMINKDIKKALKYENRKAIKFQNKIVFKNKPNLNANGMSNNIFKQMNGSKANLDDSQAEAGFAQSRGIVMNKKKVNQGAANKQALRSEQLKEIVQLEVDEYDGQLNIKPQTAQDLYFNKLQTSKIHNEMVQSTDNYVDKDLQTDEISEKHMAIQFPEDIYEVTKDKKKSGNLDLAGFMRRVTPVMEMVCEENVFLSDLANPKAKDKNPVEQKAKIVCPKDLLKVLNCEIKYISSTHTFETAPQSK